MPKFFKELYNNPHLDIRYGKNISRNLIMAELRYLIKELSILCKNHNINIILMHGSLIGWYFNKSILPYDDDIDISILGNSIYNFIKMGNVINKNYIIEINKNYINRSVYDSSNKIDARIISKRNGIFIDITFLTKTNMRFGYINCKSPHYYKFIDILPLKKTIFEGCELYVPNNYKKCLIQEYGKNVLAPYYKKWIFYNKKWIYKYWL